MKRIFAIFLVLFLAAVIGFYAFINERNQRLDQAHQLNELNEQIASLEKVPKLSGKFISNKLESVSELTSAELVYNGIVKYEDGNIPFINKKAFLMTYRSEVKAGIDLAKVDVKVSDESVVLILPPTEIFDVIIDTKSIEFYDEKSSIFNHSDNDDVIDAIEVAKQDVLENGDMASLKERAKEHTLFLLKGLLESAIGERELILEYRE